MIVFLTSWGIISIIFNVFSKKKSILWLKRNIYFFELFFPKWSVFIPNPIHEDLKV